MGRSFSSVPGGKGCQYDPHTAATTWEAIVGEDTGAEQTLESIPKPSGRKPGRQRAGVSGRIAGLRRRPLRPLGFCLLQSTIGTWLGRQVTGCRKHGDCVGRGGRGAGRCLPDHSPTQDDLLWGCRPPSKNGDRTK